MGLIRRLCITNQKYTEVKTTPNANQRDKVMFWYQIPRKSETNPAQCGTLV